MEWNKKSGLLIFVISVILIHPVFAGDPLTITHGPYLVDPTEKAVNAKPSGSR